MKKLLLALALIGTTIVANAASTSGTLSISGEVTSSCAISFNNAPSFTLISNQIPAPATTAMTLSCTAGTSISAMTATSVNGWQLQPTGVPAPADVLAYGLTMTGITAAYDGTLVTTWNGTPGVQAPVDLLAAAPLVINDAGDQLIANLSVAPGLVPQTLNVGAYTDTVTVAATF